MIRNILLSNAIILCFSPYKTDLDLFLLLVSSVLFPLKNILFPNCSVISISCLDRSLAVGQLHLQGSLPNLDNQISKASKAGARPIPKLKCTCAENV
jgi:hypothetical protein